MYCLRMKVFAQISVIRTEFKISQLGFSTITRDLLISKLSTNLVPFLFSVYHSDQLFLKPPPALHTHCLLLIKVLVHCRHSAIPKQSPARGRHSQGFVWWLNKYNYMNKYGVGQKLCPGFSAPSYGKTWTSFFAHPILLILH